MGTLRPALPAMPPPEHGGRLRRAVARHGRPAEAWLDLSTGINPQGWPVPAIPATVWQRLPEDDDGLEDVARTWTGAPSAAGCVALPGSQAAIQLLPRLRAAPCRVGVPAPGYAEHAWWWAQAGHEVVPLAHDAVDAVVDSLDVLVWIHPNNPTGRLLPREHLLAWHRRLAARGGWLVLDEAFIDPQPEGSLAAAAGIEGLVVLRSTGKFFGLAGLRGGFALGAPALCTALRRLLGPWALSHPARWLLLRALRDASWQQAARAALQGRRAALDSVLARHGLTPAGGCALFAWCPHPHAAAVAALLEGQGVLVRHFDAPQALRFGLPPDAVADGRLDSALRIVLTHSSLSDIEPSR